MTKRFRSPTDTPLHVALISGHTAVIPPEGIELAPMFYREAIARGAVLAEGATAEDQTQVFSRQIAIREAIAKDILAERDRLWRAHRRTSLIEGLATAARIAREGAGR